jgi:hypothetical protein
MSKAFHIGDLITVVTGRLVSPEHIVGVYNVVDFVTGQSHLTHQLPRACDEVKPELLRQHPWLAEITVPEFDIPADATNAEAGQIVCSWLDGPIAEYGEMHEVEPMPFGTYVGREPIAELQEMAPHAQIITVEL